MNMHVRANFSHQQSLFSPKRAKRTIVLGAGSVGGQVVSYLASMGVEDIEAWDADIVASHNVPMSVYRPKDVGRLKVEALREIVLDATGVEIKVRTEMYTGQERLSNASVVACVDTFAARKAIWQRVRMNPTVHLLCDTRVGAFYLEVLAIDPCDRTDIKRYETLMRTDKEAARQTCGMHGTILVASRAANIAAQNLTSFWQSRHKNWRVAERCDTLARVI